MEPRIVNMAQKILVGKHLSMSLADNKTGQLWQSFMPVRNTIPHKTGTDLFSLQLYPPDYFLAFNLHTQFTKWAAIEVSEAVNVPEGMEVLLVEEGSPCFRIPVWELRSSLLFSVNGYPVRNIP
jgi:AraC family transcriptional regulator